jgi:hypothetical protein
MAWTAWLRYFGTATKDILEGHNIGNILSCVYSCMTNNNRFWVGWLDLLTPSCTGSLIHNQLQELTINLQPNPSSLTVEDSPPSHSRSMIGFWFTTGLLIQSQGQLTENTSTAQQWIYVNHIQNTSSVVKNVCLLIRYLAMDVLYCRVLLYALPSNWLFTKHLSLRERVYRSVA